MKNYLFVLGFFFASCIQRDEEFCKCMEVGDKFNKASADVISNKSKLSIKELKTLKDTKNNACKNYLTMSGEEMLKKKKTCN